jgi:hypothetical protein
MKGVRSVAGIVSALGWRWGVLWWGPFAVFLLLAARARLVVGDWEIDPGYFKHHDVAATWYLYLTLAQVPVLWLRTRYALAVGHRRGPVFVVMAAVTTGLMVAQVLVNGAATQLEVFLQGDQGVLVTSTGMGKMPEPGPPPLLGFGALLVLTFGPPLATALGIVTVAGMRWGAPGVVAGFLAAILGMTSALALDFAVSSYPAVQVIVVLGSAALVSLGWIAFRDQPV